METFVQVRTHPKYIGDIEVINDSAAAITALTKQHKSVARFEFGDSMYPLLISGEYAIIEPVDTKPLSVGTIVFCNVHGFDMTHMIVEITSVDGEPSYIIGDTHGYVFGKASEIYGICHRTNIVYCAD